MAGVAAHRRGPCFVSGKVTQVHVRIQSKSQGLAATPNPRMVSNQRCPTFQCSLGCPFPLGLAGPLMSGLIEMDELLSSFNILSRPFPEVGCAHQGDSRGIHQGHGQDCAPYEG